jgi:hypothetical protein
MSTWNKVLVGLVIVVSLAYWYFAAVALKARSYWGQAVQKYEEAIAATRRQQELLRDGEGDDKPGVRQLALEVHRLVIGRGRVWRGSMPKLVKAETGEATVVTQLPPPHPDSLKAQLFVFQEPVAQSPAVFLGEFSVAAVAGQQWQLQPVRPMTDEERDRLRRSRGPWSLYEVMPGEPMDADAAQVDYLVLFNDYYRKRAYLGDLIAATTNDADAVEKAEALARQGVDLLQKEIAATKAEIQVMQEEHGLVAKHQAELEAKLAELRDAIQKTEQANRAAASELARLQLEAIRRIDARTSKIAHAGAIP